MKKFKKLKMLLVLAGTIGSLSFLNCYAMEKSDGFLTNDNTTKQEEKEKEQEKKDITEEKEKEQEKKDITKEKEKEQEKKDIIEEKEKEQEKKDITEEKEKEQERKDITKEKEKEQEKKDITKNEVLIERCSQFEKEYNSGKAIFYDVKDDVEKKLRYYFGNLIELDLILADKLKELREKQGNNSDMSYLVRIQEFRRSLADRYRNFQGMGSAYKKEGFFNFDMLHGRSRYKNFVQACNLLLNSFTQAEAEKFKPQVYGEYYGDIEFQLLKAIEEMNILNENLEKKHMRIGGNYVGIITEFRNLNYDIIRKGKNILINFKKNFVNDEFGDEEYKLIKDNENLIKKNKVLMTIFEEIEGKCSIANRLFIKYFKKNFNEFVKKEKEVEMARYEGLKDLGYDDVCCKSIGVYEKLTKLNRFWTDMCSEADKKCRDMVKLIRELSETTDQKEIDVDVKSKLININEKLTKLNENLFRICVEFEENYNRKCKKIRDLPATVLEKGKEIKEEVDIFKLRVAKDKLLDLNKVIAKISNDFEKKYDKTVKTIEGLREYCEPEEKENFDEKEEDEKEEDEKEEDEKKEDEEEDEEIKKQIKERKEYEELNRLVRDSIDSYRIQQLVEENKQLKIRKKYFEDLHNKLKRVNEIVKEKFFDLLTKYETSQLINSNKLEKLTIANENTFDLFKKPKPRLEFTPDILKNSTNFNKKKYEELKKNIEILKDGDIVNNYFNLRKRDDDLYEEMCSLEKTRSRIYLSHVRNEQHISKVKSVVSYLKSILPTDALLMAQGEIINQTAFLKKQIEKLEQENAALKKKIDDMKKLESEI